MGEDVVKAVTNSKSKQVEDMDLEIKKAELELKRLEKLEKEANLQDLQERLAEREMKRQNKIQRSVINGNTLRQLKANDEAAQKRCNHRKGGNGAQGLLQGQGDDPQYAILKHQMPNGDIWVRCLRCGKTWKPPIKEDFYFNAKGERVGYTDPDAKFNETAMMKAQLEYEAALQFQTRNVMSGSIQFRFSDGGEHFRKVMKDVTLR